MWASDHQGGCRVQIGGVKHVAAFKGLSSNEASGRGLTCAAGLLAVVYISAHHGRCSRVNRKGTKKKCPSRGYSPHHASHIKFKKRTIFLVRELKHSIWYQNFSLATNYLSSVRHAVRARVANGNVSFYL